MPGVIELLLPALSASLPSQSVSVIDAETLSGRGAQDDSCQECVGESRQPEGSDENAGTAASDVVQLTVAETFGKNPFQERGNVESIRNCSMCVIVEATCTSRTQANIRLSMRYCAATLNESGA